MQQVYSPASLKRTMQQSYLMWSPDYSDFDLTMDFLFPQFLEAFDLIQTLEDISATKN